MEASPTSSPIVPVAIIIGFAMVALAVYFTGGRSDTPQETVTSAEQQQSLSGVPRPVDETDYIRGNPNAPILIVEYSDYDCPFCKQYHETLKLIMDEYGVGGRVAWVYRQFPLQQLHPNAPRISEAALCVGDIGGNDAFWKFTDQIFELRELDEFTNPVALPDYATEAGVSRDTFVECLDSGRMQPVLRASMEDALNIGAQGTPHTVVLVGNQQAVLDGAQSYENVKLVIDGLLGQLDGASRPSAPSATTTQ